MLMRMRGGASTVKGLHHFFLLLSWPVGQIMIVIQQPSSKDSDPAAQCGVQRHGCTAALERQTVNRARNLALKYISADCS